MKGDGDMLVQTNSKGVGAFVIAFILAVCLPCGILVAGTSVVRDEVTVATNDPPPAVGFNEEVGGDEVDGLNWTAPSDNKKLEAKLKAPEGELIKCSEETVMSETVMWTCDTYNQWLTQHTYETGLIYSTDYFRPLFSGPLQQEGGEGDGSGPPPVWEAGVVLANIQADANNDSDQFQRPPTLELTERTKEEIAEQGTEENPAGLIVPLNIGRDEGSESLDYVHEGIVTNDKQLVRAVLELYVPNEVVEGATLTFSRKSATIRAYRNGTNPIVFGFPYPVESGRSTWELLLEGTAPSSSMGEDEITVTLTPANPEPEQGEEEDKYASRDSLVYTTVRAEITGYVQGESDRNIDNMEEREEVANVVASGYIKYEPTITPSDIVGELYFKWSTDHGTLQNPTEWQGSAEDHVKWDASDAHEQMDCVGLELSKGSQDPTIIDVPVYLFTIRPYVVRVKFVDDTIWNEEHDIYDGDRDSHDAEFSNIASDSANGPVCYIKDSGMQFEVDLAGSPADDSVNNLTKQTEIRVEAVCTYNSGTRNTCQGDWFSDTLDEETENWSHVDFDKLIIETLNALPNEVTEFEDFSIEWTFKVKNSSGQWVASYALPAGYSQITAHCETPGNYGLYSVYTHHKFNTEEEFVKEVLDYAATWASGANTPDAIRSNIMAGGFQVGSSSPYHYTDWGNCLYLSSDYTRMSMSVGLDASVRRWNIVSNYPYTVGDARRMCPGECNPVGPMDWAGFNTAFPEGWGFHAWVESGSNQYDASVAEIHSGSWGSYEDACFSSPPADRNYRVVETVDGYGYILTEDWVAGQAGREQGCEGTSVYPEDWTGP
jgi:hypothetical protein